jgi:hypothetical protein
MRTVTVTVIAVAVLSLSLCLAACGRDATPRGVAADDAARLLIDRNWLDSWPQDKDDHLVVYRFVPSMGGGVFQDRTVFKGTFELFQFTTDGASIDYHFPHDGLRKKVRYRIEHVDGPAPFDLKLTISGDPRGPGTYWGLTSDHGRDLDALLAR